MKLIPGAKSIEEIRQSVTTVPWTRLTHAYHSAWDAPAKLEIFLDPASSQEQLESAVDWMWGSILHQGSIYSASTPVIWILVDLIAARPDHSCTASVLYAVQTIADGFLYLNDDNESLNPVQQNAPGEPVYEAWTREDLPSSIDDIGDEYFDACFVTRRQLCALVRHAIPVICCCLTQSQGEARSAAIAAALGALQVVPDDAQAFFDLREVIGDSDYDPGTWVSVAMVLGELGQDISEFIEHADRRVRLSAAMSIATKDDPRSVTELASALSEPDWIESAFPNHAAHLSMMLRFHVLEALLGRSVPETVAPSVVEAICRLIHKRASKYTVDMEWGKVLYWAFPDRLVKLSSVRDAMMPLPDVLTDTQAAILRSLCAKEELWDRTSGNASLAYRRVQLPYDRQVLCNLANALS